MEHQLTTAQETLIECLQLLGLEATAIITIMLMIPEDEQIAEMAEYLLKNPKATESDILKKAVDISEE